MEESKKTNSEQKSRRSKAISIAAISLMTLYIIYGHYSYYAGYVGFNTLPIRSIGVGVALIVGSLACAKLLKCGIWINSAVLGTTALISICFMYMGNIEAFEMPNQFPQSLLFTVGCVLLCYAALGKFAFLPLFFIFLTQTIRVVCSKYLGITFNSQVLAAIIGTSKEEAMGFINTTNISMACLLLAVISGLLYILMKVLKREKRGSIALYAGFILGCAIIFRFALTPILLNQPCGLWPCSGVKNFLLAAYEGNEKNKRILELVRALPSPSLKDSEISTLKGGEGVICILHIGESVRSDKLSINGYERDTTPWLRSQERLINYQHCISVVSETIKAFVTIMTNGRCNVECAPSEEYMPTVGSVLDLFADNGITCSAFMGAGVFNERSGNPFCGVLMQLTKKAKEQYFDEGLPIQQVDTILNYVHKRPNGENMMLLVNNAGSHIPFHLYDENLAPFQPTSKTAYTENPRNNPQKGVEANNAYDNTINMLDMYIQKLLTGLKGRPFIYIYIGDHGEYTGQEGIWNRAEVTELDKYYASSGCIVPMLIYPSPEFEAAHPHFADAVKELQRHSSMTIGHEHLFHTLLGIFGISTPYYDASLDLSSPKAEPYTGPQPGSSVRLQDGGWH